jgi:ribulose-5-phosphate 4-epimerase/fuculose-1-phosphate aldolase
MFIHAAVHRRCAKARVLHTHMPYATALTLTQARSKAGTTCPRTRCAFMAARRWMRPTTALALDDSEERLPA